ncbi:MAG: hypothetical protein ACI936_001740 [Paraglaciecola sp.]|jgi:hypothetical protein
MKSLVLFIYLEVYQPVAFGKSPVNVKVNIERTESPASKETLWLPYAFSTDDMGFTLGLGVSVNGIYQEQLTLGTTTFGGEDSKGVALGAWDYRLGFSDRLFVSVVGMIGDYPLMRAYAPPNRGFTDKNTVRPGSNNSDFDDFIEARGSSNWWELQLDYVLPIGNAKSTPIADYQLTRGLPTNTNQEADSWNPLINGTTILSVRQFNRYQFYETGPESIEGTIHAIEIGLLHDNTDFPINPTVGNSQYFAFSHDAAWLDSEQQWNFVEFEASQYFSFGASKQARQRILALNFWTAYATSWKVNTNEQNEFQIVNNPPFLEGATLGGFYRMRGFRQNRFHDKAAIYASAEYRYTLDYNPVENVNWLRFLKLDWIQAVLFVEGGRVAPTYNRHVLYDDWKADYGFSLRALTAGMVVRLDVAKSSEGTNMWAMISHPF